MSRGQALLDQIIAGTAERPPHVRALRLPNISGWEPGRVWAEWRVDPQMFHRGGAVFGGYLAALADSVLALAMFTVLSDEERFSTADLRILFFRPVTGGTLRYEASVLHRGKRVAHVEALFRDDAGRIVCKATATQIIRPMSQG